MIGLPLSMGVAAATFKSACVGSKRPNLCTKRLDCCNSQWLPRAHRASVSRGCAVLWHSSCCIVEKKKVKKNDEYQNPGNDTIGKGLSSGCKKELQAKLSSQRAVLSYAPLACY